MCWCVVLCSGADLLAVNADGNMAYDLCDDVPTLEYIELEMSKRGLLSEFIARIPCLLSVLRPSNFGPGRVPKHYDGCCTCSCSYMVLLPVFKKCLRLC